MREQEDNEVHEVNEVFKSVSSVPDDECSLPKGIKKAPKPTVKEETMSLQSPVRAELGAKMGPYSEEEHQLFLEGVIL